MAQRCSGYSRIDGDAYVTPRWVYDALFSVERFREPWDCAPIDAKIDFLAAPDTSSDIVTNPPFSLADEFCRSQERAGSTPAWGTTSMFAIVEDVH